jgi:predicted ester cyclase
MTTETEETPRAANLFRRVIEEGFNRGNFDAWDGCFPERYAEHQDGHPSTLAEFKRTVGALRHAFPDLHLTIEELITRGDKVWARMTARGTHLGPFMGFAPTEKPFTITVIDICRVAHGRIVEHWGVPDRFALLRQLGLLPPPSTPAAG